MAVQLGIVGLPSDWVTVWLPALEALRERVRITAVFDHVSTRARQAATRLGAHAIGGVLSLAERSDVDALLVLNLDWHRDSLLPLLSERCIPILLAANTSAAPSRIGGLHESTVDDGSIWLPGMPLRYEPTTIRLKELVATELGATRDIRIECRHSWTNAIAQHNVVGGCLLAELIDWVRFVSRSEFESIEERRDDLLRMRFVDADVSIAFQTDLATAAERGIEFQVQCEHGRAVLDSNSLMHWHNNLHGKTESLTADRPSPEVMLDLFCRRVVGGLIPVPTLVDVREAMQVVALLRDA